jgi:hypothetical protein
VLPLAPDEVIEAVVDTRDYETNNYLVVVTRNGQVEKTNCEPWTEPLPAPEIGP